MMLITYVGFMFGQYLTVTFWVSSSVEIKSCSRKARFPQFRILERFCVEGSNKRNDRCALQ